MTEPTWSYQDDRDNRGVFLELWVVDLLEGDYPTAILFSQLLWWHQPGKNGQPRATYEREGHRWLLRADDDWGQDCRMTLKQVRRSRSVLVQMGLVIHRRYKLNGAPTSAWRPDYEGLERAMCRNSELPSEGHFQGTNPGGAVGTSPGGAVPIPYPPLEKNSTGERRRRIPEPFIVTAAMQAWAAERYPGVDWRAETEHFRDHHRAKGSVMVNWEAAWRTWIIKAGTQFAPRGRYSGSTAPAKADVRALEAMEWALRQEAGKG